MSLQTWRETLVTAILDGTALSASTTPTSLLHSAAKFTLPANFFYVGRGIRIIAQGRISTLVTTPGTLTLDVRLGGTVVANGGAMALNIVAKTNVTWKLEWDLLCRSVGNGSNATLFPVGEWKSEAIIAAPLPAAGGTPSFLLPSSAPAVGTGFDSTVTQQVDLFGTWSVNSASNSIQVHKFQLISIN